MYNIIKDRNTLKIVYVESNVEGGGIGSRNMCVRVCVCVYRERESERKGKRLMEGSGEVR